MTGKKWPDFGTSPKIKSKVLVSPIDPKSSYLFFFLFIAIEHQYTGKTSYKDHAYRMLLIWLHGLSPSKDPFNEIYDALIYIDREEIVEKIQKKIAEDSFYHRRRFRCHCLPAIPSTVCHYCSIV